MERLKLENKDCFVCGKTVSEIDYFKWKKWYACSTCHVMLLVLTTNKQKRILENELNTLFKVLGVGVRV